MNALLVQLGDSHLTRNNAAMSTRFEKLPNSLRDLDSDVASIIVLLTGDLTWSGTKNQFDAFSADFKSMLRSIAELFPGAGLHVAGVPGNHDCDFSHTMAGARQHILRSLARSTSDIDKATVDLCCSVQENFFAFLDEHETPKPFNQFGRAAYDFQIPVGTEHIVIRCFNTALSSMNPENPGQLIYPLSLLKEPKIDSPTAYWVALFHHPYSWLAPATKRTFMERVENSCDLILTGHEHAIAYYKKEAYSGLASNYVEGAAFSGGSADIAGFNAVIVDLGSCTERLFSFKWERDYYAVADVSNGWRPYRRSRIHREFELSEKMLEYLQDPGAQFTHPAKPNLRLEDIFVPPNVQELRIDEPDDVLKRNEIIESRDTLTYLGNSKRTLIMGGERSGKTTLAKVLFRHLYAKGQIPVLVNGAEIRRPDTDKFRDIVHSAVSHDYRNASIDKFDQLDDDDVTVLIDDFDHARLNTKGKIKLLQAIAARYTNVIIFADDVMWLTELVSGEVTANLLAEFKELKIAEFGYVLRSAIIDKWYDVNVEYVVNPEQLSAKVETVERYVDDFLGKSYLPSVPIFILMLLQSFDASQPIESSAASYGYLYSILITRQLAMGQRKLSLDKKLAYLIELAFYMYKRQQKELSVAQFDAFHREHCARYVWINPDLIKQELEAASILELYHDMYRFKYNYFYLLLCG
jgi:Calcineurin-like phosphoesterase